MKYFLIIYFIVACSINVFAIETQQLFSEGNNAYQSGNYTVAIQKYEEILRGGQISAETYYNLGNAYAQQGQTGLSVLNLERASRLRANDPQIMQSLQFVRRQIVEDVPQLTPFFMLKWWQDIRASGNATMWSCVGLLFLWGSAIGLIEWLVGSERRLKVRGFIVGLSILPLGLLSLWFGWQQMTIETAARSAIITAKEIKLRTSPDENSPELRILHEGIKIEILEKNNTFVKIRLPNAEEGWLDSRSLSVI